MDVPRRVRVGGGAVSVAPRRARNSKLLEHQDDIIACHRRGDSLLSIATGYGVSIETLWGWLKRHKLLIRRQHASKLDPQATEILQLRAAGLTLAALGKRYGVTGQAIGWFLKRHGAPAPVLVNRGRFVGRLAPHLAEIQSMRAEGQTLAAIGDKFGVTESGISVFLKRHVATSSRDGSNVPAQNQSISAQIQGDSSAVHEQQNGGDAVPTSMTWNTGLSVGAAK